jgi:hypothetical protein
MASNVTQDVQEQILGTIRKSQELTLDALKTWVETVQSIIPSIPGISSVNLPFADQLPNAHEAVARGYDFAEQFLSTQRKFADEVLAVTSPLLPGDSKSPSKASSAK